MLLRVIPVGKVRDQSIPMCIQYAWSRKESLIFCFSRHSSALSKQSYVLTPNVKSWQPIEYTLVGKTLILDFSGSFEPNRCEIKVFLRTHTKGQSGFLRTHTKGGQDHGNAIITMISLRSQTGIFFLT